jgi:hypothetical protein
MKKFNDMWEDAAANSVGAGGVDMPADVQQDKKKKNKSPQYDGRTKEGRKFVEKMLARRKTKAEAQQVNAAKQNVASVAMKEESVDGDLKEKADPDTIAMIKANPKMKDKVLKSLNPRARREVIKALGEESVDEELVGEAMTDKEKKKRLAMIKRSVEKINSKNADKAKKDALRMMKDSGMFDESVEEAKAPKMKGLSLYGSEISGLKRSNGSKLGTYTAKPVLLKGKLAFRVTDNNGGFETLNLKTFAKMYG